MRTTPTAVIIWIRRAVVLACLACASPAALAQTATVTFDLENVWLLPHLSHPGAAARPMTGRFDWTYEIGDFENGTGQFIELSTPWYDPGVANLNITVELTSIEFSLIGNWHDLGLDLTLFLVEPLSPDHSVAIDTTRSMFEIQQGVSHQGHVVSGSVVPVPPACPEDVNGDGTVNVLDVLAVLAGWGQAGGFADVNGDGVVNVLDLLAVLSQWGSC